MRTLSPSGEADREWADAYSGLLTQLARSPALHVTSERRESGHAVDEDYPAIRRLKGELNDRAVAIPGELVGRLEPRHIQLARMKLDLASFRRQSSTRSAAIVLDRPIMDVARGKLVHANDRFAARFGREVARYRPTKVL